MNMMSLPEQGVPLAKSGFDFYEGFPAARSASTMLQGSPTHYMLYGGSGSGKTIVLTRAVAIRAMGMKDTTHAILRFRFNHLKASIINDTFPFIMKTEFPDVAWELNKSDWFVRFPWNDSLIYYGGLDEKERSEKILGQGHSTIYLNECSQISYASRQKAVTRLRQARGLRLRFFYDCNPPPQGHWTYKLFAKGLDPIKGLPLPQALKDTMQCRNMHPRDNPHLPEEYVFMLRNLSGKDKLRFWDGEFVPAVDGALWTYEQVENVHLPDDYVLPVMSRVVVAVDPSGCHGPEDKRSDEIGIVVAGLGMDGRTYILEDATDRLAPGGADGWGQKVVRLFKTWRADQVIAEENFGGAMVENTIRTIDRNVPFKAVKASRGKQVRADPVSALYAEGKVLHRIPFPEMEEQMCNFSTAGYEGQRSPDRADAMVWAVTDLAIGDMPGMGLLEWYEREAKIASGEIRPPSSRPNLYVPKPDSIPEREWQMSGALIEDTDQLVAMMRLPGTQTSTIYGTNGQQYVVGADGIVNVLPDDVIPLMRSGFIRHERTL